MIGWTRICIVLMIGTTLATSLAGCSWIWPAACIRSAEEDIRELKQIVQGKFPQPVAATLGEQNDCDSGEGGSLYFNADRSMPSDEILGKFVSAGWERIESVQPGHPECGRCIDGITTKWGDRTVDIVLSEGSSPVETDILVEFQQ
ncbi:hypothetical protein [Nonomuraea dietziae]|uniref:hypothetical protein n=1 Tax=Nonomuraea dietziae TaxID=65515 RepID=UPI00343EE571